jgi:hypothetical protein
MLETFDFAHGQMSLNFLHAIKFLLANIHFARGHGHGPKIPQIGSIRLLHYHLQAKGSALEDCLYPLIRVISK